MKKFFKWLGILVLGILVIGVIAVLIVINKFTKQSKVEYAVNFTEIAIPTDSASLARGAIIAQSTCTSCHGGDFAGTPFFEDEKLGSIPAPNITKGGRTKNYTVKDWQRTLRYGVKPDGHGAFIMPSTEFNHLSDSDLGSLIAYMQTVPVSDKQWPDPSLTTLSKILAGAGMFGVMYPASVIDMSDTKPRTNPPPGPTVEYGAYTVAFHGCKSCHGEQLNGYISPDPLSPPGANITPAGNIGKWSLDQFKNTLRTGETPEGKKLDTKFMPWTAIGLMTDMEAEAVFNYLRSMPALDDSEDLAKYKEKNQ